MAVEFAINNNYKEVTIAYDYQWIESWALGTWKRNNKITSEYNEYMQNKMKEINIRFKKIKGHSGHKYNDLASTRPIATVPPTTTTTMMYKQTRDMFRSRMIPRNGTHTMTDLTLVSSIL